jgi:hypothetical protein
VYFAPRLRGAGAAPAAPGAAEATVAAAVPGPAPAADSGLVPAAEALPAAPADEDSARARPGAVDLAAATPAPAVPPAGRDQPPVSRPRAPDTTAVVTAARPPAPPTPEPAAAPPAPAAAVDYPIVMVEGLEIVSVTREGEEGSPRIVVRQLLPSGDTLDLRGSDLGEGNVGVGAGRVLVRAHPSGGAMGTVRVGRFLVNARAPVAPEVLEGMLARLVERAPN